MFRHSKVPLLLAIMTEAMGYGAIFGLLADLQDTYHFSNAGLGFIAASAFPAALIGQLGLSRFADRGHTRWLLWFGLATAAGGMIWFWLGNTLWEFVVARVLVGLGSGTFIPAARRVILSHDPDNPGKAISYAGAADIGGFVLGIPLAKGLHSLLADANKPFLVIAILLAVVGPIASLVPEPPVHSEAVRGDEVRRVFNIALARSGILIGLGFAVIIGTFDAVAARFLKDLGGTDSELVLVMVALFVPLVIFMPLAGRIVDRLGPVRVGVTALVIATPGVIGFGMSRSLIVIGFLGTFVALAYSAVYTAGQAAVAGGTIPRGLAGAGQGAYEATYAIGAMTCSFAAPMLYSKTNSMPMWTAAGAMGLCFAAAGWWSAGSARRQIVKVDELVDPTEDLSTVAEISEIGPVSH
jgi:MFS family permease